MTPARTILLSIAVGALGFAAGRVLPRPALVARTSAPALGASVDACRAVRAELTSTRAELAICMAYERPVPAPTATADAPPSDPLAEMAAEGRRVTELLADLTEAYVVLRKDGTLGVYRPEDVRLDGSDGEILSRKFPDGRVLLYLGADAGAPSDPNAYGALRDLAGPDGIAHFRGRRYRWGVNGRQPPHVP